MRPVSDLTLDEALRIIEEQRRHLERQSELIKSLLAEVARLREEVDRLGGGGVGTSGVEMARKVPQFVKPNRAEKEKPPRKQREHGYGRKREAADEEIVHAPDRCSRCGGALSAGWEHDRRQVIEVPFVRYRVTDHVIMAGHCGVCGRDEAARPDLSGVVVGKSRFGVGLSSLVAHLSVDCRMPIRTIQRHLLAMHGLSVSQGGITEMLHRTASIGRGLYSELRRELLSSAVIYADETGMREDGVNGYIWTFCTDRLRYYLRDRSRSMAVPQGVLGGFRGTLVSDFYAAYNCHPHEHQYCWAHVFTDMRKLKANHPGNKDLERWCGDVARVYKAASARRHPNPLRREDDRDVFEEQLHALVRPYVRSGLPQQGLAARLCKHLDRMFVFVEHREVAGTNNAAERAIRPLVTKRKVCGGTRSPKGSQTLAILASLFETWRLRGEVGIQQCRLMLSERTIRAPA